MVMKVKKRKKIERNINHKKKTPELQLHTIKTLFIYGSLMY